MAPTYSNELSTGLHGTGSILATLATDLLLAGYGIRILAFIIYIAKSLKEMSSNGGIYTTRIHNCWKDQKVYARVESGDGRSEDATLSYQARLKVKFRANVFGTTHYWCTVHAEKLNGDQPPTYYVRTFPIFNKGAPKADNHFDITDEGIRVNGEDRWKWGFAYSGPKLSVSFVDDESLLRRLWVSIFGRPIFRLPGEEVHAHWE